MCYLSLSYVRDYKIKPNEEFSTVVYLNESWSEVTFVLASHFFVKKLNVDYKAAIFVSVQDVGLRTLFQGLLIQISCLSNMNFIRRTLSHNTSKLNAGIYL